LSSVYKIAASEQTTKNSCPQRKLADAGGLRFIPALNNIGIKDN